MNRTRQLIGRYRTWKRFKDFIVSSTPHFIWSSVQTFEVGYTCGVLEYRLITERYLTHMPQIAVLLL